MSYDDFVVPECPECLAQGQRNTNTRGLHFRADQRLTLRSKHKLDLASRYPRLSKNARKRLLASFPVPQRPTPLRAQIPRRRTVGQTIPHRNHRCDLFSLPVSKIASHHSRKLTRPHRLVKHALELGKSVLLLNVGPTRADGLVGIDIPIRRPPWS
jgi:hypothetical protein